MEEINKAIGKRLQEVRRIYNNGYRCSAEQLAGEIGESVANIRNYECGKAGIPNRVLLALYHKGINPIYLLSGEGEVHAPNAAGEALQSRTKDNKVNNVESVYRLQSPVRSGSLGVAAAGSIVDEIRGKGRK